MNVTQFINDLGMALTASGKSQKDFANKAGLDQGHFSRVIRSKKSIKLTTAIALWPFVYGAEFPHTNKNDPQNQTETPPCS